MLRKTLTLSTLALSLMLVAGTGWASKDEPLEDQSIKSIHLEEFKSMGPQPGLERLQLHRVPRGRDNDSPTDLYGIQRYPLKVLLIDLIRIKDTTPLGHLHGLQKLTLFCSGDNAAPSPALVMAMKQLNLAIPEKKETSFDFLRYLESLTELKVDMASFDLGVLTGLPKLESVDLSYCDLLEKNPNFMQVFATLPRLRSLNLYLGRELKDISALSGCCTLESLTINMTEVASLEPLRGLPLKHLDVSACGLLKDISPIADMKLLETLNVKGHSHDGWETRRGHPSLRRIQATADDLYGVGIVDLGLKVNITPEMRIAAVHNPYLAGIIRDADRIFQPLLVERDALIILRTMPRLEAIFTTRTSLPEEQLKLFQKIRPDVFIGAFAHGQWATVSMDELRRNY
jgi:hypothetical protein